LNFCSEDFQYLKDYFKYLIYKKITGIYKKSKTNMQSVLLQLKVKNLWPDKVRALEMFGRHGLWHTMDYVAWVDHPDIFELNPRFHELSQKNLKKYPVSFYNSDSIRFIQETQKKYDLIVADSPYGGNFYAEDGLPYFFNDFIKIADVKSIIIFNCHTIKLAKFEKLTQIIHQRVGNRICFLFHEMN